MNWTLTTVKYRTIIGGIVMGICCSYYPASAIELPASSNAVMAKKIYATVWRISGKVTATRDNSAKERTLHEDDAVYLGEHLKSDATSEAILKIEDGGVVAIRPNAEFVAETFSAQGNATDNFSIRLFKGSLRMISGWISRTNRAGVILTTSTATIGIRGTDHEPYVLSAELALGTPDQEGTYDKVNRGGTTLKIGDAGVDIDAGKVGFAREPEKNFKGRALMTILLPVLLDKVPAFFVPGQFDAELDQYSETASQTSQMQLEQKLKRVGMPLAADCTPKTIAKAWLNQLDSAIGLNDAQTIIAMFAPEAAVRASVRDHDGNLTGVNLGREEFVQSTIHAMKGLKDYKQRRVSLEANVANSSTDTSCNRISIKSGVIEEGFQSGKPFRFESLEEYLIELHDGKWLSFKAETTQK